MRTISTSNFVMIIIKLLMGQKLKIKNNVRQVKPRSAQINTSARLAKRKLGQVSGLHAVLKNTKVTIGFASKLHSFL